jgi:hypothetical protein
MVGRGIESEAKRGPRREGGVVVAAHVRVHKNKKREGVALLLPLLLPSPSIERSFNAICTISDLSFQSNLVLNQWTLWMG